MSSLDLRKALFIGGNKGPNDVAKERLKDYEVGNPTADRKRLTEKWRQHHPEAANEVSSYLKPLIKDEDYRKPEVKATGYDYPHELWHNDTYHITVRRYESDIVFGSRGGMVQIGISSLDGSARHDWRDFQAIKNQICGVECEGFELYPAESRLMDPSNYFSLWCFPGVTIIRVGKATGHTVYKADDALAPQRAFPEEVAK